MRELLIALQKQAAEMEFNASVMVQEIGLALDQLEQDAKDAKAERLAELNRGLASVGLTVR